MPRKRITIDDLARMTKEGFDEVGVKFKEVTDWQKWATRRFDNIGGDLKAIRKQLTGVVYRHGAPGHHQDSVPAKEMVPIQAVSGWHG